MRFGDTFFQGHKRVVERIMLTDDRFTTIYELAVQLSDACDADALLILLDGPTEWQKLKAGGEDVMRLPREELEKSIKLSKEEAV